MVRISFIYADNCEHCQEALSIIEGAVLKCPEIACEIVKFLYDSRAAIGIASTHGIDDLPGFLIGLEPFVGSDHTEERIVKAIKKAAKQ